MQIILLESIERVGKAGEIVAVKDGYANNFLLPKKLAIVANKKNRSELDTKWIVSLSKMILKFQKLIT
jgi:large subunit ribosomal protein L9